MQYIEQARRAVIHSNNHPRNQNQNQSSIQMQPSNGSNAGVPNNNVIGVGGGANVSSGWDQMNATAAVASIAAAAAAASVADNTTMSNNFGLPAPMNVTTGHSMYSKPVGKRDAMLSGGCSIYNAPTNPNTNTNNSNNTTNNNNNNSNSLGTNGNVSRLCSGRWEPERSPMAAVPRDYQAGPDTTPISIRDDKYVLNGKYRQFLRSQRLHPYLMASGTATPSFPQLTSTAFQQMQQVSCYNV